MTDTPGGTRPPVAAIDCGTNTIKLLVGTLPDVAVRESRLVRLGQDTDRTGRLAPEALARTFAAIDEYAGIIARHGVPPERVRFCATSASRDAENRDEFAAGVRARLGVDPEVVTGAEEAALSFGGAVGNLRVPGPDPVLVVDVGGGSTELVLGTRDGQVQQSVSMPVGSVRLHERHLADDPPTDAQVAALLADVDAALADQPVPVSTAGTVVAVAGTALTVAAAALDLSSYDPDAIDQTALTGEQVDEVVHRLRAMTVSERRELGYMEPGRADVIGAGALILDRMFARSGAEQLVVSESDILDGIAWSLVDH